MAWIELDKSGMYHIGFRLGSRKFKRSLRTDNLAQAEGAVARLEENIALVHRGRLDIPPDADVAKFLLSDGKLNGKVQVRPRLTLSNLFRLYFDSLPVDGLEKSSIDGMKIHERQLERILGKSFEIQQLTTADLQRYVEKRSKEPGRRGRTVTPTTIKKAVVTLRTVWNWAGQHGHLKGPFPNRGLKYPKDSEKPPFQTWKEIEQQIARGRLAEAEQADLWDCLFLLLPEIDELLDVVKKTAAQPWIYPAVCFAAHTGARRSEIVRSKLSDIDLLARTITIHERKRDHAIRTTRRVPISPFLAGVLESWMAHHPGGQYTFCQNTTVTRSRTARNEPLPVTHDEAHDHLKRTLKNTKWKVLRGWHIFRHSFCSNCAAAGIDQRVINAWVGHQTEAMVHRYRHLIPNQQQEAIARVFAAPQRAISEASRQTTPTAAS